MLKKYLLIYVILIVFIFYGCDYFGPGTADYSYHVSDKYIVYRSSTITTELIKKENKHMNVIVDSMVSGIGWDKNFVLVEQTKNNFKSYWIIDINQDKIYGQLDYEDFDKQRDLLKIDSKLNLESPDKYKKLDPTSE